MPTNNICFSHKRYRCYFASLTITNKTVNAFSNNKPNFQITEPFLYSTLVRNSVGNRISCKKTRFINKQLNAFGSWEGAPSGSQKSITNLF